MVSLTKKFCMVMTTEELCRHLLCHESLNNILKKIYSFLHYNEFSRHYLPCSLKTLYLQVFSYRLLIILFVRECAHYSIECRLVLFDGLLSSALVNATSSAIMADRGAPQPDNTCRKEGGLITQKPFTIIFMG